MRELKRKMLNINLTINIFNMLIFGFLAESMTNIYSSYLINAKPGLYSQILILCSCLKLFQVFLSRLSIEKSLFLPDAINILTNAIIASVIIFGRIDIALVIILFFNRGVSGLLYNNKGHIVTANLNSILNDKLWRIFSNRRGSLIAGATIAGLTLSSISTSYMPLLMPLKMVLILEISLSSVSVIESIYHYRYLKRK